MTGPLALRAADGATVTLERYPILLGRSTPGGAVPDVDVSHLDSQEGVDNRHCELFADENGVEVHDLGGVSGTWVDGRRLPPGGRAVLSVGGTLRVAGVQLALIFAPGRRPTAMPPAAMSPGLGEWNEPGASRGVPLPPSASSASVPEPVDTPRSSGMDLTGAPLLARPHLEGGADAVRLVEGFPLQVRRLGVVTSGREPLSLGEVEEAARTARRALGLADDSTSGWGFVGDLELDFLMPPVLGRPYVGVVVSQSAEIPPDILAEVVRQVSAGYALLVAARRPDLAARTIALALQSVSRRPRVLSDHAPSGWIPSGWAELDSTAEVAIAAALEGDPLVVMDPTDPVLRSLLGALPRAHGGTLLTLRAVSPEGALERLVRLIPPLPDETQAAPYMVPFMRRTDLSRLLPSVLYETAEGWRLTASGPRPSTGSWDFHTPQSKDF